MLGLEVLKNILELLLWEEPEKSNPRIAEDFIKWADEDTVLKIIDNTYKFVREYINPDAPYGKEHIGYIVDRVGYKEYKKVGP